MPRGSRIIYIGFADSINRGVSAAATETLTISIPKVQEYFKEAEADEDGLENTEDSS